MIQNEIKGHEHIGIIIDEAITITPHIYTQEEIDEAKMKAWKEMALNGMTRKQRKFHQKEAEKAWKKHQRLQKLIK